MKAHNKYPETFLGDPAIDFVMLAKAQGIEGDVDEYMEQWEQMGPEERIREGLQDVFQVHFRLFYSDHEVSGDRDPTGYR